MSEGIILFKWWTDLILRFTFSISSIFDHTVYILYWTYRRSRTNWYTLYCKFWLLGLDSCNYPLQYDQMSIWVCAHNNDNIIAPKMVNILKWQAMMRKEKKQITVECLQEKNRGKWRKSKREVFQQHHEI